MYVAFEEEDDGEEEEEGREGKLGLRAGTVVSLGAGVPSGSVASEVSEGSELVEELVVASAGMRRGCWASSSSRRTSERSWRFQLLFLSLLLSCPVFAPALSSSSLDELVEDEELALTGISPHLGICTAHNHCRYVTAQSSQVTTGL